MASNWAVEINGDDDEDTALKRAIAMSLGEEIADEDGLALKDRHVPAAAPVPSTSAVTRQAGSETPSTATIPPKAAPTNSFLALGIDRKKMEEERLARLTKRKTETIDPDNRQLPPAQRPKLLQEPGGNPTIPGVTRRNLPDRAPSPNSNTQGISDSSRVSATPRLPFPQGVVKRTWVYGQPRRDDDIKIEEVLQKNDLELAVLSSFQWDEEWLMSKLNLRKTKVVLVAYAVDEAQREQMRNNVPSNVIRFCFPPMEGGGGAGSMHSKLQLLKYPKYLRVVIPTGNLVSYDWGEIGTLENMCFLIDLPRIEDDATRATNALPPFGEELCYFLKAQGLDEKMITSLRNYDFSETVRYGFVHTIAGSHPNEWQRTGYCGLGRAVNALGLGTDRNVDIDYMCASIGAVNQGLLKALYYACQGDSGMKEYEARAAKSKKSKDAAVSADQSEAFRDRIRVYFPSHDTVLRSRGGKNSGGTICFQSRWWNATTFPHEILRDYQNTRRGILVHSKIMFVRRNAPGDDGQPRGWAYVGSANLSESAWGRLVKDRATAMPRLTCRNWECGVLIPASPPSTDAQGGGTPTQGTSQAQQMQEIFRGTLDVPMELPGTPFHGNSRLRPWFYHEE